MEDLLGDEVLTACAADLAVIDPDPIISGETDAIATPDILRVKILSKSASPISQTQ